MRQLSITVNLIWSQHRTDPHLDGTWTFNRRHNSVPRDAVGFITQSQYFISPSQPHVTTLDVSWGCHRQLIHTASCALNLLHRSTSKVCKGKEKEWEKPKIKWANIDAVRKLLVARVETKRKKDVPQITKKKKIKRDLLPVQFSRFPIPDTQLPVSITWNKVTIKTKGNTASKVQ